MCLLKSPFPTFFYLLRLAPIQSLYLVVGTWQSICVLLLSRYGYNERLSVNRRRTIMLHHWHILVIDTLSV